VHRNTATGAAKDNIRVYLVLAAVCEVLYVGEFRHGDSLENVLHVKSVAELAAQALGCLTDQFDEYSGHGARRQRKLIVVHGSGGL